MRSSSIATSALVLALGTAAIAQRPASPPRRLAPTPPSTPAATPAPVASDETKPVVYQSGAEIPPPPANPAGPTMPLPTEPIEPYLLTKDNGPLMVMAKTFRGPDAAKQAQALAMELRSKHSLPSYVFYLKIHPGGYSNIYNIPPTAPTGVRAPRVSAPERYRTYDEAAVLVGNCKTQAEQKALLHRVKKLHPVCIDGTAIFTYRKPGLGGALMTTNPLVPAQMLYPGRPIPAGGGGQAFDPNFLVANFERLKKVDPLIKKMNTGPYNIFKCSGPYTMPVATFTASPLNNATMAGPASTASARPGRTNLVDAAEGAEVMAEALSKVKAIRQAGYDVYVYHDLTSSRVTVGSFKSPDDPDAERLRALMTSKGSAESLYHEFEINMVKSHQASQSTPVPSAMLIAVPRS